MRSRLRGELALILWPAMLFGLALIPPQHPLRLAAGWTDRLAAAQWRVTTYAPSPRIASAAQHNRPQLVRLLLLAGFAVSGAALLTRAPTGAAGCEDVLLSALLIEVVDLFSGADAFRFSDAAAHCLAAALGAVCAAVALRFKP